MAKRRRRAKRGLAGSQADHEQAALATIARFERVVEDPRLRYGSCTFKFGRILELNKIREGAMTDLVWLYRADKAAGQKARRSFGFFDMKRKEFEAAFERDWDGPRRPHESDAAGVLLREERTAACLRIK
jgi:hypothetical protein